MFLVFNLFIFVVDFVLKFGDNLFLFAFSWIEIKYKVKHCQGENLSIFVLKMYEEMSKMRRPVEENKLSIMIKRFLWEFNLYWKFTWTHSCSCFILNC